MILGERILERLGVIGISQAELARRVGVSQPTINGLIRGPARKSPHLHVIARELRTSPAYLTGESSDPDNEAPALPSSLKAAEHNLVDGFRKLALRDQSALTRIVGALSTSAEQIRPEDHLPDERALARMFEALLMAMDRSKPLAEQARLLAQRLPIGLSQLRDLIPAEQTAETSKPRQRRANRVPEPQ